MMEQTQTFHQIAAEAPNPRLWKSLGVVMSVIDEPSVRIEAHYALAKWGDELDVDREGELRQEAYNVAATIYRTGQDPAGMRVLRYASRSWPELVVRLSDAYAMGCIGKA